jgi:hypothetical protein
MNRLLLSALVPLLALAAGQAQRKGPKPPQLEVLELTAKRTPEGTVEIDGRVRNCGEKSLQNLVLRFKVLAPGQEVLTTQKGTVDPEVLEPGEEAEFHWRMREPARAVTVLVTAMSRGENVLTVDKPGPYTIE